MRGRCRAASLCCVGVTRFLFFCTVSNSSRVYAFGMTSTSESVVGLPKFKNIIYFIMYSATCSVQGIHGGWAVFWMGVIRGSYGTSLLCVYITFPCYILSFVMLHCICCAEWHASKNCFIDGELVSQGVTSQSHIFTDSVNGLRFRAYCDMRDRAWTVFQRRTSTNPISFYRDFRLYRDGFGSPETSFWLGLEPLHLLTALKMHELRVDMEDVYGNVYVAEYAHIYVGDAADNYRLTLGAYSGTPHGDFLRRSSGAPFSTLDSDNDMLVDANCARMQRTGWWLRNCTEVRFNGEYSRYGNATHAILGLSAGRGIPPLHMVEMKIRPATCRLSCHWLQNKFSSRAGRDGQL